MSILKAKTMMRGEAEQGQAVAGSVYAPVYSFAEDLVFSEFVSQEDLERLLDSLASEDSAHSWKNLDRRCALEDLLRWENSRRPTRVFFFHLRRGDGSRIVGAGAVAEHLNSRFTNPGFCVLGRCFIMPEFRGRGFYRRVLQLRLDHCRARLGSRLKAVHMGSDNARIANVVTGQPLPGWPRFAHLGEEELAIAGHSKRVDAYLMLLPEFATGLADALDGPGAPPSMAALRGRISRGEGRDLGIAVRDAVAGSCRRGGVGEGEAGPVAQLLAFCRAVPLVGFQ